MLNFIKIILFLLIGALAANARSTDTMRITLDMRVPIQDGWLDPTSETVGLRGDSSPLSWGETLPASDPQKDGFFEVAVPMNIPSDSLTLSCKIKVDGTDNPNDGWQAGRNHIFTVYKDKGNHIKLAWDDQAAPPPSTITGRVEMIRDFQSDSLRPRDLFIYLPPDYDKSNERYPVLYMHDGQNLFDASSVGQEWGLDEAAESLIKAGKIEPLIIVGIANTPDRMAEYTPTVSIWHYEFQRVASPNTSGDLERFTGSFVTSRDDTLKVRAHADTLLVMLPSYDEWQPTERLSDRNFFQARSGITFSFEESDAKRVENVNADKPPRGGAGNDYGDFLVNTLKPFIDQNFRTRDEKEWTALGGSSLGGLISMHLGLRHADVFGHLLVMSPSVWWDDQVILKTVTSLAEPNHQRIFLYVGTGERGSTVRNTVALQDALLSKGWSHNTITYIEAPDAGHHERSWAAQAENILRFVFTSDE